MKGLLCAPLLSVLVRGDTHFFPFNFEKGPFKYSPPIPHFPAVTAQALSSSTSTNKTTPDGFITIHFDCNEEKFNCEFFQNALTRLKTHLEQVFDLSEPIG
jgi:hypothetical protein